MDILILDSWLRDFLITSAKPAEISKYVSLCGPSIERVEKLGSDSIYHIEVTTNRIDSASVYGIAREAAAILPRFGIPAKLKPVRLESKDYSFVKNADFLSAIVDKDLCSRFTTALIKNVKIGESNEIIKKRLESEGIRPINNVVDISNYIMLEMGQPVHTFDYDKIKGSKMILRASKKGEKITTLDGKEFTLPGNDIVIEDGEGRLIDLAGIMGGKLSEVDSDTKNILLFVQTYNPVNIRKTSMALSQRTQAATIFEKGTDEELVAPAVLSAIEMFKKETGGIVSKTILDIYPKPYKTTTVQTSLDYIYTRLGVEVPKKDIAKYLQDLGFECSWSGNGLSVMIPSWRAKDVKGQEDIVEEIARIYGYHNLPSVLMEGCIPDRPEDPKFAFERNLKHIVSGFGGTEVYTLSLVSEKEVDQKSIKIKNPLGPETEYMRTSLMPSLIKAAKENEGTIDKYHLFEIANIYLPRINDLPEERLMLGGILAGYEYRSAKGIVEAILERLHINFEFVAEDSKGFGADRCVFVYCDKECIGKLGMPENSPFVYYEFVIAKLIEKSPKIVSFESISKYPGQEEDITFILPQRTKVGDVAKSIISISKVQGCSVGNPYNQNNYTFHIWYRDLSKTLTDTEVAKIRKEIIASLKSKFGALVKE